MAKPLNFAQWSRWSLWLLAFLLPYELDGPLLQVGPLVVTNVEIALGIFLFLTALSVWQRGKRPFRPPRYWQWLALFILFLLLSTAFAPEFQSNALKATLRLLSGTLLALSVMQVVQTRQHVRQIGIALLLGGLTAVSIGIIEVWQNTELAWLTPFRDSITVVGPFIRLTGPFDYANQAAMFIEATLPLLLALAWEWTHKHKQGWRDTAVTIILIFLLLFYLETAFLTLSRASFGTIIIVATGISFLLFLHTKQKPVPAANKTYWRWWATAATITLLLTALNPYIYNGFRFRVQQLTQENPWYHANIIVTEQLQMESGETKLITISVTNEGTLTWQSNGESPIYLGARWLNVDTGLQHGEPRWSFATAVLPGEAVTMQVPLTAPEEPGTYKLRWDIVQEQVTWFAEKSGVYKQTVVAVSPHTTLKTPPIPTTEPLPPQLPITTKLPIPNRQTLWQVALQMIGERPLIGYGLDNYRLLYGRWLNATNWNQTIHTNNWYLEILVSVGVIGSLPFFIWMALMVVDKICTIWQRGDIWQTAIAAALFTFMVHGLLDFFLLFTTTALLFWLLAGLWMATKNMQNNENQSKPPDCTNKTDWKQKLFSLFTKYQQQSNKPITPLIIAAILYAVIFNLQLLKVNYDFSAFITAGDLFVDPNTAPPDLSITQNSAGYDGQFYYRLALTPFTTIQTDQGITIDKPAYRQQRILYPLLGRLLSLGNPHLLPESLVLVNFLALCLLTWFGAKYVQLVNLHAIWGLAFALFPGFLLTLSRNTTEIVAATFLLAAVLALRQQRRILAGILLLLATFTKETALIVSFGLLLEALLLRRQRNIQDQWFPVLAPIISYLLWQTWLKSIWDNATVSPAAISTNLGLPFFGISPFIQSLFPPMDYLQQVWLLEIFLMALFLLATVYVFLWSAARPFIKISWLLFAALMFSLTQAVWVEDWAFLRVFSETYLFSVLILLESKSVLKKWVLGEVVFSWTLLATEMLKMR